MLHMTLYFAIDNRRKRAILVIYGNDRITSFTHLVNTNEHTIINTISKILYY